MLQKNNIELVLRLKGLIENDISSFEWLYKQFSKSLYHYVFKLTKNEEESLEIVQLTFIKIWKIRTTLDVEKSFLSFIHQIATNLTIDYLRQVASNHHKQEQLYLSISNDIGRSVEDDYIIKEKNYLIDQIIDQLPVQQKQVFKLCKMEGYSYREASEILHISVATISSHMTAAIKNIKEILNKNKNKILFILFIINDLI